MSDIEISNVISQNIAAVCNDGVFAGSLTDFEPGFGYWFRATTDFNFTYPEPSVDDLSRQVAQLPEVPSEFSYNQSMKQAFYFVEDVVLKDGSITTEDWLVAYHNETVIGARRWNGEYTDIPAMGSDDNEYSLTYATSGSTPTFKLYRPTTGELIDMDIVDIPAWYDMGVYTITLNELDVLPDAFALDPAYPNPFNPVTNINFALPQSIDISLDIYDVNGRKVKSLISRNMDAGYYSVEWNASQVASGIYFVKLYTSEFVQVQKLMLVK